MDALFFEQVDIAAVFVDTHDAVVLIERLEMLDAARVGFEDFCVHIVGEESQGSLRGVAAAQEENVAHIGIILLSGNLFDVARLEFRCHEVDHILVE